MFNPFYKINLFYTQKECLDYVQDNHHSFVFTVQNPSLNKEGKRTYLYGSSLNASTFLTTYNKCEHKHFYEMITDNIPIYEYYDLDLKVESNNITNEQLLTWFNNLRNEFIKINYPSYERDTDFIITTATNETKLSLHILNRNLIFDNKSSIKIWYNSLKEFVYKFYSDDPLKESIDFSVCSNNRTMRIIGSSKFGQDRPLKLLFDKDNNNEKIYPIYTLITNAQNDIDLNNKLVSLSSSCVKGVKEKVSNTAYETFDTNNIEELLSLLSSDRAGDYNDWIRVGWALKRANVDINIFKEWSRENSTSKFNRCEEIYSSYNESNEGVSLGTIHHFAKLDNPIGYSKFIEKNKHFKVEFPFTSHIKIDSKYINENIYIDNLKTNDVIALKSNMNTGKTYSLPHLFNDYKVKVVVYFRISLNISIFNKWKNLGFELYSDIKENNIKTDLHNNIIIQIDSLHRIQGKIDLLILDELESTHEHICSSIYINKNLEYTSLRNMIKNTPKIIACDANLKDETINTFFRKKNVIKIENTYTSFCNLSCKFFFDTTIVIQKVFDLLSSNKNIVIPTNSKNMANKVWSIITKKFPDLKILKMDSDSSFVDISEWKNYNVVIYTPKIVAGISFDEIHFHSVVGFFINKSCNAEPSSQMLFRVRNLIDNDMFIYTPHNVKERYLPIEDEDIFSSLNNIFKEGKVSLDNTGLDLDKYNEKVIKNEYYLMYKSYIKKKNISKQYFYSYLRSILKNHGIKLSYDEYICPNTIKESIREEIKQSTIELKIEEASKIASAIPVSSEELLTILDTPELLRSEDDTYSIKRYNLIDSFDLPITTEISTDWVINHIPYVKSYRNYKQFSSFNSIDDCISFSIRLHEEKYNRDMLQSQNVEMSSSEDSGYEGDGESVIKKKKISLKKTICHALTYDRKYLKMKVCLEFIKHAGFTNITHKGRIKLHWNNLYNFIYRENKNISSIFESKPFKFISKTFDPEDGSRKKVMMEFVNRRLEDWFGVKIIRFHRDCDDYILEPIFNDII